MPPIDIADALVGMFLVISGLLLCVAILVQFGWLLGMAIMGGSVLFCGLLYLWLDWLDRPY